MKLIGLTGPKGSGKSTVGRILARRGFECGSFAAPIKAGLEEMFGLSLEHLEGGEKETPIDDLGGVTPRYLMQTLGTEWGRNLINQDIWVKLAKEWLFYGADDSGDFPESVVFTDVRFKNEARWIHDEGGVIWHIYRENPDAEDSHASEAGVSLNVDKDLVIYNNSSIEKLEELVAELVG